MLEIKYQPTGEILKIDTFWLRDHCRCNQCYNLDTKQRKYNLIDLPADVKPLSCQYVKDGLYFEVEWSDDHKSSYDVNFIYKSQVAQLISRKQSTKPFTPWERATIIQHEKQLRVTLSQLVSTDEAVKQVVTSLIRHGIALIDNVPTNTTMTEMAVRRIFPVMRTFFGEMYTFSDVLTHADTAYTKLYLGSHTDNTYFCDAAGLQILHCLSHVNGTGGENFFTDGLHAVQELKRRNPKAYEVLTHVQVPAEYIEDGEHHRHTAPIICVDPVTNEFRQLRLNAYDRAVFDTLPQEQMQEFYLSLRELLAIVQSAENQWQFKLHPGTMVLFDNWRVCHGRCAYTGSRTMTGCYVQRTDYISKARVLGIIE